MKTELLEKLLDAGFSKDEIMLLIGTEPPTEIAPVTPTETPTETPPETPTETAPETPTETPTETAPDVMEKRFAGIEKSIVELTKAIQTANLKNDSFNESSDSLETQTENIFKSIIRPDVDRKDE